MITINQARLKEIENESARKARAAAFTDEYDQLAGKYARGEATKQELIDKASDIRSRFPYQE